MKVYVYYKDTKEPDIFDHVLSVKETDNFYVMRTRDPKTKHLVNIKVPIDNVHTIIEHKDSGWIEN